MNIIELQDNLKDLPDSALMQEMQMPTGNMPQFLVLSELKRRKRMRDEYQRQQAADMPTVAEEVMTAAGAPQQGLTAIARNMAPNSSIAQNTSADMAVQREPTRMPQMMADGGILKMARGGIFAQPTGQDGTYILVQDGERVPGTGIYPNFRSANEAAKSLRGTQPYQTQRILEEPAPILQEEVSELSKVNPDPMAFAVNDEARRSLQMRQAMGDFRDGESGGIASINPLGRVLFDENIPSIPSQADDIASSVVPDFDATTGERSSPTDATIGSYGRTTVGQTKDEIERMNQMLDLAGIGPETESDVDMIDLMTQAQIEREGFGAGQADDTSGRTTGRTESSADGDGFSLSDLLPDFSNPLLDLNKGDTTTEKIVDESLQKELIEAGFTGGDIDPSDVPTQTTETPLSKNIPDQSRSIPEMPIDSSLVMPPMMGDTGGEETAAPMMPTGTDSYGALESRIAKMLADREKAAESDKYLALAQAGLALMASDSPTLAGAIGEAGLVGIGQLRDARSQYDKDVLELLSTQADIDSARADRNLELQELALERDELEQTRQAQEDLSKYRMASLDPRNASISDLQAGLNYINGEIQTQATTVTYDEVSGEEIEKIDMTKVDPQLLIQKKSLEDSLLTRLRGTGADFDATGS